MYNFKHEIGQHKGSITSDDWIVWAKSEYRGHPENASLRSLLIPHLGTIHPINGSRRIGQYDSINERLPLYWNCISSVQIPLMENQDLKISLFFCPSTSRSGVVDASRRSHPRTRRLQNVFLAHWRWSQCNKRSDILQLLEHQNVN